MTPPAVGADLRAALVASCRNKETETRQDGDGGGEFGLDIVYLNSAAKNLAISPSPNRIPREANARSHTPGGGTDPRQNKNLKLLRDQPAGESEGRQIVSSYRSCQPNRIQRPPDRLLDTAPSRTDLRLRPDAARYIRSSLFAGGLASGGLAGGLLGTSHRRY